MISTPFGPEFHGGSRLFLSHWIVISWRFVYIGYFFFVFVRSFSADLIDYEIPFMYLHVGVLCRLSLDWRSLPVRFLGY